MDMRKIFLSLPALLVVLASCASYQPSSAVLAAPEELRTVESDGLVLGLKLYRDPEEQQALFDADLAKAGVIAIDVRVENHRAAPVLVRAADATLTAGEAGTLLPASASRTAVRVGEKGSKVGATIAFGLIGALAASQAEEKARSARVADYRAKALKDIELGPGERAEGVIFFIPPASWPDFDDADFALRLWDPAAESSVTLKEHLTGIGYRQAAARQASGTAATGEGG